MHLEMQINTSELFMKFDQFKEPRISLLCSLDPAVFSYPEPDKPSARSTILFTYYLRVMKTNLMHYLSSVYFVNQTLHVSGIFVAHHQEVHCMYTTIGTYCAFYMAVCFPSWDGTIPTQLGQQTVN
jgi:hypothetical protein